MKYLYVFISVTFLVAVLVYAVSLIPACREYAVMGWWASAVFGVWSFVVVRMGRNILRKNPTNSVFLRFFLGITWMKFFLFIIMLLFYLKVMHPATRSFAWYMLVSFLPYFIYETWAFYTMSKSPGTL